MNTRVFGFDEQRLTRREALIEEGAHPYPYSFESHEPIGSVIQEVERREGEGQDIDRPVVLTGRIWAQRKHGKSQFWDLRDSTGKIQIYLRSNTLGETAWSHLAHLDLGDLIGVEGTLFRTRMGELTVNVDSFTLLAKSVVPIPIGKETDEKTYYRASDPEIRYRERYLHWMLDEGDYERIRLRTQIIAGIRQWMNDEGFLEVTTPTIEFVYGGAEARPFRTSIWALGRKEAFLRISPELYLKRYIVAGFDKVYTICQNFRNEGIDHSHNPEFTMMEWYEAYTDYNRQMERFETLVAHVCESVHGSTHVRYQDVELDFTPPWRRITVLEALEEYADLNVSAMSAEELALEMKRYGLQVHEPIPWGVAVAELFEHLCEPHLIQPVFVLDHPIDISPLTKVKRGDPRLVERFEPYAYRMEIGNAYSELTDPVDQLNRFAEQRQRVSAEESDDYEIHPVDADFVKAIGCGMPPTGGVGLGIDRLIMLLTDAASIRDIIPFPMIKPRV